METGI